MFRRYLGPRRHTVKGRVLPGWYVRVYDPKTRNRSWLSLRTEDYRVAQARMRDLELREVRGATPLLGEAAREWLADVGARAAARTLENLENAVKVWPARWMGAEAHTITSSDVRRYLAEYRTTHAATTTNSHRAYMRWFFSWLVKEQKLARNPVCSVSSYRVDPRPPRALSCEEQDRLLRVLAEESSEVRALYLCALEAGLRRRTILELTWSMVDFEKGWFEIPARCMKSHRFFRAPMSDVLVDALRRLRADVAEHVFPGSGPIFRESGRTIEKRWHLLCARAGITNCRLHDLRKTFVTNLRRRGVPFEVAKELSDHRDLRTLIAVYSAVADEDLERAVRKGVSSDPKKQRGRFSTGESQGEAAQ